MNNEIEEILDFKENADYKKLSCDEIKVLKDYITNLQNNWYDLKTYCKLERHESNSMKEGQIYNEIITKMEQLEKGE